MCIGCRGFWRNWADVLPTISGAISLNYTDSFSAKYSKLLPLTVPTQDITFDITDTVSISNALKILPDNVNIDWVFIATGWLHDDILHPEKLGVA